MSPKIPQYDQQVGVKGIQVGTPQASLLNARMPEAAKMPEAAFGGDVAASQVKLGGAVQGLGKIISDHVIQLQEEDNKKKVLQVETAGRQALDDLLLRPAKDANGNDQDSGLFQQKGDLASGVTKRYDDAYKNKIKKSLIDGLDNQAQKDLASQVLDNQYIQRRSGVVQHEVQQGIQAKMNALQASLDQDAVDAPKVKDINGLINAGYKKITGFMSAQGASQDEIDNSKMKYASKTVLAKADNMLTMSNDWKGVKKMLSHFEGQLDPKIADSLNKDIKKSELFDKGIAVYESLKGLKMADGYPDEAAMAARVKKLPGLNSEEKDQMEKYVRAKAGQDRQDIMQHRSAQEEGFMNAATNIIKNGGGIDAIKMITRKYAFDSYTETKFNNAAEALVSAPGHTDPTTYMNLWKGVQDKTVSETAIDAAMAAKKISTSNWMELKKDFYTKTFTQEEKNTWTRVELLADTKFKKKEEKDAFLLEMTEAAKGKNPAEVWTIAQDKLKGQGGMFWNGPPQWKKDAAGRESILTDFGNKEIDLGGSQIMAAIGRGIAPGRKFSPQDIDLFASVFGGMDNVKVGTPVNAAIQTLIKNNAVVTVANIKALLKAHPKGILDEAVKPTGVK